MNLKMLLWEQRSPARCVRESRHRRRRNRTTELSGGYQFTSTPDLNLPPGW